MTGRTFTKEFSTFLKIIHCRYRKCYREVPSNLIFVWFANQLDLQFIGDPLFVPSFVNQDLNV